ncbi:oxidoreductase [Aspergillus bertholletiae]|uniref:Oxidoreductase n=1 Tax=Aspergillus bertholletiae TaxID=1226010 RepID=A0A5N7BKY0_9EURO|nr:oxidoreductase [Aspergillus bertholletiae]
MSNSLRGKVFCVTGAASGIGLGTMKALLEREAYVGITDLNEDALDMIYNSLPASQKSRIFSQTLNVADRDGVKSFLEGAKRQFGRIDGVVNSAGTCGKFMGTHEIWQLPTAEYDLVMDANVRGTFNVLAECLKPGFMEPGASVVNVASSASQRGMRNGAPYSTSKHAIVGLTKSAAQEVGHRGIRVNAVLPGTTDTPMLHATEAGFQKAGTTLPRPRSSRPIPRVADVSEVSNVILFLLSPESSFVTGSLYNVDGGVNC